MFSCLWPVDCLVNWLTQTMMILLKINTKSKERPRERERERLKKAKSYYYSLTSISFQVCACSVACNGNTTKIIIMMIVIVINFTGVHSLWPLLTKLLGSLRNSDDKHTGHWLLCEYLPAFGAAGAGTTLVVTV